MALITTTHGEIDEDLLTRVEGALEDDHEYTTWVEYYLGDDLVRRDVHVTLKRWPEGMGAIIQAMQ